MRKSPFDKDYAPRGVYEGAAGNPEQWRQSFKERFSPEEIKEILGDDDPYGILGIRPGATQEEIKTAFRKKSRETHPDITKDDGETFKRVKAAYDKLYIRD